MNKKTLIISVILVVVLVAIIAVYFFVLKPSAVENTETPKDVVENEFYSVKLPEGWIEIDPVFESSAMVIKQEEQINDTNAREISFRSYYSVLQGVYDKENEQEYLKEIKDSLKQSFAGITTTNEETRETDNGKIYFIESKFNQQDIDFRVLLAVNIKGENIWIISFNTIEEKWEEYKDLFYQVAESFKIK